MSALRCNAPLKYQDTHKQRPPINRQKLECHCNTSKILRKHDYAYMRAQTPHTLLINISSPNNVVSAKSPLFHFHFSFPQRHYTSLYSLFLDWSQAFDSIGHQHLAAALRRYGIPPILIHAIMALYHNAKFFVSEFFSDSPHHILHRGIRQGCPLSPFLFIIILSALTSRSKFSIPGNLLLSPLDLLLQESIRRRRNADDTVLIARTQETLSRLLRFQHLAASIGFLLNGTNGSKCQLLCLDSTLFRLFLSPHFSLFLSAAQSHCNCT